MFGALFGSLSADFDPHFLGQMGYAIQKPDKFIYIYIYLPLPRVSNVRPPVPFLVVKVHQFQQKNSCNRGFQVYLVGGFNPSEEYESNWESSPIFGVKIKNI